MDLASQDRPLLNQRSSLPRVRDQLHSHHSLLRLQLRRGRGARSAASNAAHREVNLAKDAAKKAAEEKDAADKEAEKAWAEAQPPEAHAAAKKMVEDRKAKEDEEMRAAGYEWGT